MNGQLYLEVWSAADFIWGRQEWYVGDGISPLTSCLEPLFLAMMPSRCSMPKSMRSWPIAQCWYSKSHAFFIDFLYSWVAWSTLCPVPTEMRHQYPILCLSRSLPKPVLFHCTTVAKEFFFFFFNVRMICNGGQYPKKLLKWVKEVASREKHERR